MIMAIFHSSKRRTFTSRGATLPVRVAARGIVQACPGILWPGFPIVPRAPDRASEISQTEARDDIRSFANFLTFQHSKGAEVCTLLHVVTIPHNAVGIEARCVSPSVFSLQ